MAAELISSAPSSTTTLSNIIPSSSIPSLPSSWHGLTDWTVNVTRYAPVLEDIVWAGPRIVRKLGSLITVPENANPPALQYQPNPIDSSAITIDPDSTIQNIMEPLMAAGGAETLAGSAESTTPTIRLSMDGARGLGSVFGYATSKWALCCIAMAIILNRTHIFAATRRRLRLRWPTRLMLRALPIIMLVVQARWLLQSMQCQTSPDFAQLRWGNASKSSDLMFSQTSTFLNSLSSTLLFSASDESSCQAVQMIPYDGSESALSLSGSLSLLWPLFQTFCVSQFLETVACAVQGRPVAPETGMTLFEQSLAFAEADAAISNQLGWGLFSKASDVDKSMTGRGSAIALSRSMIMKRVNTPPEVLLIAFLSSMTHITSHVLGVFNLQARYRLLSTGFWGLCFMGSIVWSAISFDLDDPSSQGLLRFPTVCIVGFVPHVLVLAGIVICLLIYGLALLLSAMSPTIPDMASMSFRQRLAHAHENMQANVSLSEIRITREMDFYTALLRTGFGAITMASEAVYLNEDRGVSLKRHTWLEEERFREVEELQRKFIGGGLPDSRHDQIGAIGLIPVRAGPTIAANGYARERAAQKVPKGRSDRSPRAGIGASERSSRWLMALEFLLSVNKLLARLSAKSLLWCLGALRIRYQPSWLMWLARHPKSVKSQAKTSSRAQGHTRGAPLFTDNERAPRPDGTDVEAEFRRVGGGQDEENLDSDLYKYWLKGGWWGSGDSSGDFVPHPDEDDFDTTSVVSMSVAGDDSDQDLAWESEDGGQRTPTQRSPQFSREGTPFVDSPMQISDLARLLHPTNPAEREEARTLSAHLQNEGIMTRSKFRQMEQLQRTRILATPGSGILQPVAPSTTSNRNAKLSSDEEERLLEQLLLSRRQETAAAMRASTSWEEGGSGFGSDGPQCVVCQSSPRTIIVWPCRCLSLCDDCRVSLAMNNFDKCVCCRREVISFSRIFVP